MNNAEQKKLLKVKHDFENDIIMAAKNIGKRYAVNRAHIQNMEMTAMAVFDAMKRVLRTGRAGAAAAADRRDAP